MRYTTLIDISELPAVWRSANAARVYTFMAFKAGYHDNDRDLLDISIRNLAKSCGLTLSATRCALNLLCKYHLLNRVGNLWKVEKWIVLGDISPRPKTKKQERSAQVDAEEEKRRQELAQEEKQREKRRKELRKQGKTEFMLYYEDLQRKASSGEQEAAALLIRHRATYQEHARTIQMEKMGAASPPKKSTSHNPPNEFDLLVQRAESGDFDAKEQVKKLINNQLNGNSNPNPSESR